MQRQIFRVVLCTFLGLGQQLGDFAHQAVDAFIMLSRNRDRIAQAQLIGFKCCRHRALALGLVRNNENLLLAPPQPVRKMLVLRQQPDPRIEAEQHQSRIIHSDAGGGAHPARQAIGCGFFQPGGVHQQHLGAGELKRVDFPTFGRPVITTFGSISWFQISYMR